MDDSGSDPFFNANIPIVFDSFVPGLFNGRANRCEPSEEKVGEQESQAAAIPHLFVPLQSIEY